MGGGLAPREEAPKSNTRKIQTNGVHVTPPFFPTAQWSEVAVEDVAGVDVLQAAEELVHDVPAVPVAQAQGAWGRDGGEDTWGGVRPTTVANIGNIFFS